MIDVVLKLEARTQQLSLVWRRSFYASVMQLATKLRAQSLEQDRWLTFSKAAMQVELKATRDSMHA